MSKEVELSNVIELMIEKLEQGGNVAFTPCGKSMLPMLRDGEDVVILTKPNGRLHLFDIPFYKRSDGSYVLHRVVNFDYDGSYVLCGDNQFEYEHGITDENIIAVVTAFCRKGKSYTVSSHRYRFYLNFWHYTRLPRRVIRAVTTRIKRILPKRKKNTNEETSDSNGKK